MIRIDCYISQGCSSEETLRENIKKALDLEGIEAEVNYHIITDEDAVKMGLKGSPSVLINGEELQPAGVMGFG